MYYKVSGWAIQGHVIKRDEILLSSLAIGSEWNKSERKVQTEMEGCGAELYGRENETSLANYGPPPDPKLGTMGRRRNYTDRQTDGQTNFLF